MTKKKFLRFHEFASQWRIRRNIFNIPKLDAAEQILQL